MQLSLQELGAAHFENPHPDSLPKLTLAHLRRFDQHRRMTVNEMSVLHEMTQLRMLLLEVQPPDLLAHEVREFLQRPGQLYGRWRAAQSNPPPGYSDREFAAIMAAARKDVVALRQRLRANRELVEQLHACPESLTPQQRTQAELFEHMLSTGQVPLVQRPGIQGGKIPDWRSRKEAASQVFLVAEDLVPLLVLGVGLSGRNGETIKELSHFHRVLENRAAAVNVLKRRRGKSNDHETIHWEIGSESSHLHTPGGWFLLVSELSAPSRRFCRTPRLWAIWTVDQNTGPEHFQQARRSANGHIDPFELKLGRQMKLHEWVTRHGLTADPAGDGGDQVPLALTLGRLKKTVEVRTVRRLGGHLPSASRTNTPDVSFLHYLRNDPRIKDWAERVLTEALEDTEASARAFQGRIIDEHMAKLVGQDPDTAAAALGTTVETLAAANSGKLDTLVTSCLDFEHSPHDGGGLCTASFLTCLRCPNALVAERHLPKLYALLTWLQRDLERRSVEDWCGRHGVTWLIVTRFILPKFTTAQQARARESDPALLPLHLLDDLTEFP